MSDIPFKPAYCVRCGRKVYVCSATGCDTWDEVTKRKALKVLLHLLLRRKLRRDFIIHKCGLDKRVLSL